MWTKNDGRAFKVDNAGNRTEVSQIVEQRWFAGVHSDIGGGYDIEDSEKSAHIPLFWMAEHARGAGLRFTDGFGELEQRAKSSLFLAPLHDSMTAGWTLLHEKLKKSPVSRPVGNEARRNSPTGTVADELVNTEEVIDLSVKHRFGQETLIISESMPDGIRTKYQPQNYVESMVDTTSDDVVHS